ncbi:MAG TPA: phenylacetate--CoA ligase [Deltaproteobacteria bacterium]|jgi:phenylacetate-CoA ligase|nr:phenylacetate--CoA ligase [Deltaproteobacteria bacterium]HQI00497.1 phenylacetate--CoA ligase [Deltaproteobacteria bacterium]HQJ08823.1 phenylacetate--CoA ligase [Deltaproteobacteria bacterium]
MGRTFMPAYTSSLELEAIQLQGLKWTVNHAYNGSPFYRESFARAGVKPEDIRTLDDLQRLPFVTAQDLQEGYPFPLRSVPYERIVRIHASSGTTGKRKVMSYTRKDIDDWADMFARCYELAELTPEDRVQICVGYGVWTAGVGFQNGCERFGAMALPVGPGNTEMHLQFLQDFQPSVICSTASMALLLAEEAEKAGILDSLNVKKVIMGAERSSDSMRDKVRSLFKADHIFDIPGLTEVYGPGTGLDCVHHTGIHYFPDFYILEILDPETLEPVRPGETGEMVYTTLCKEGAPLIRYRSRDLTRLLPGECPCGSILPRHDRIMGRSDDMFIIRGVNIYPSHIEEILSRHPGLASEYQVILERKQDGKDYMEIRVERSQGGSKDTDALVSKDIATDLRKSLLVSGTVEIVDYGSLPRTGSKSKRILDRRD